MASLPFWSVAFPTVLKFSLSNSIDVTEFLIEDGEIEGVKVLSLSIVGLELGMSDVSDCAGNGVVVGIIVLEGSGTFVKFAVWVETKVEDSITSLDAPLTVTSTTWVSTFWGIFVS